MRISVCRSCHLVKKWGNMYSCMCIFFLHRKYLVVCKKLMILVASEEWVAMRQSGRETYHWIYCSFFRFKTCKCIVYQKLKWKLFKNLARSTVLVQPWLSSRGYDTHFPCDLCWGVSFFPRDAFSTKERTGQLLENWYVIRYPSRWLRNKSICF